MFDLSGKSALVTGASGGIGGAIARRLHQAGANVGLSGTRADALEALAAELGERCAVLPCDLSDGEAVGALIGQADEALGSVDIVITNPPFHQGHALDSAMTDRLLAAAARVLQPGGTAYVVAQRHENLHTRMLQWFTDVEVVSKHPSHVVLQATTSA